VTVECGVRRLADGFGFIEGPRWRGDRLYLSDFFTRRVHTVEPDGSVRTVCEVPGQPFGLGFTPEGDLLISSMTDRRVFRLRADTLFVLADLSEVPRTT
jgi:sugar lactone lactonase YvrE